MLLIPPAIFGADPGAPALAPSKSIVVAGAANLAGLRAAFDFAVRGRVGSKWTWGSES